MGIRERLTVEYWMNRLFDRVVREIASVPRQMWFQFKEKVHETFESAIRTLPAFLLGIVGTSIVIGAVVKCYPLATAFLGRRWSFALITIGIFGAGFGAHLFKKWKQLQYGAVEIAFGLVSGGFIAWSVPIHHLVSSQWSSIVGCIYVVARGFNNISDASTSLHPATMAPKPSRFALH